MYFIGISVIDRKRDITMIENNRISKNLEQMEKTVELLRIQKHDYMNHLQVILMQVSRGKNEDTKKYI